MIENNEKFLKRQIALKTNVEKRISKILKEYQTKSGMKTLYIGISVTGDVDMSIGLPGINSKGKLSIK